MGAIGNYVHLKYQNYKKYGISQNKEQNFTPSEVMYAYQKQYVKDNINSRSLLTIEEKDKIKKAIQLIMRPSSGDREAKVAADKVWKETVEYWNDEFDNVTGDVVREFANVKDPGEIPVKMSKIQTKYTGADKRKVRNINLGTITTRANKIVNAINSMPDTFKDKKELVEKLDMIFNELADLSNLTNEELKAEGFEHTEQAKQGYKYFANSKIKSVVDELNKIIGRSAGTSSLQKGTLFEDIIAAAFGMIGGKAESETKKIIKETVKGGTDFATAVEIDTNLFDSNIDWDSFLDKSSGFKKIGDNIYASTIKTQNKIDVEVTFNDNILGVSAKNVNLASGFDVHLVTGASLLAMLSTLDSKYVNHYFNIMAEHSDITSDYSAIKAASDSMKTILFILGLKGYKAKAQQANIFIVNDNSTGEVYIIDMNELIQSYWHAIDLIGSVTANGQDIKNLIFRNEFNNSGYPGRITKLIADAHTKKISVALKPSIIKEF